MYVASSSKDRMCLVFVLVETARRCLEIRYISLAKSTVCVIAVTHSLTLVTLLTLTAGTITVTMTITDTVSVTRGSHKHRM